MQSELWNLFEYLTTVFALELIVFFMSTFNVNPEILCVFLYLEANMATVFTTVIPVHRLDMGLQALKIFENFIAKFAFSVFDFPHGFPLVFVPKSWVILHIAFIAVKVAWFDRLVLALGFHIQIPSNCLLSNIKCISWHILDFGKPFLNFCSMFWLDILEISLNTFDIIQTDVAA